MDEKSVSVCDLASQSCGPCNRETPKISSRVEYVRLRNEIPRWHLEGIDHCSVEQDHPWLRRDFTFNNFKEALAFVNRVGALAEQEGHHPDIHIHKYKRVTLTLTTHAIGDLSMNDFILAAKIDRLPTR